MALRDALLLVMVWMLVTQIGVGARNWNWSTNQELEVEKEGNLLTKPAIFQTQSNNNPGYHWAILRTNDLNKKYTGASMKTSVYNPQVSGDQYSACRVKVQNGEEYVEAGWMVNQALFNDTLTHFYIYTKTKTVECFNNLCSGFVLVRQDNPPGLAYNETTVYGRYRTMEEQYSIEKDQANGNWYLRCGLSKEIIGWWPKNIFSDGLADAANFIDWGGEVYSPPNQPSPAMGSGLKALSNDIKADAYCRQITVYNENYVSENAAVAGTETFRDTPSNFYDVSDAGVHRAPFYRIVFFGGLGQFTGK